MPKLKISLIIIMLTFACSTAALARPNKTDAYFNNPNYKGARCEWQPSYWIYHKWHSARRLCWGGDYDKQVDNCGWVPAHRANGVWYKGRRACW